MPGSSAGKSSKVHIEREKVSDMTKDYTGDAFRPAAIRAAKAVDASEAAMAEMERELMADSPSKPSVPLKPMPYVASELVDKAKLFAQRAAVYGNNFVRFGPIMAQLMATQKLDPTSEKDMARFGIFVQVVSKVTRYAENFNRGGHDDSLDDIAVYAMMLKALDNDRA